MASRMKLDSRTPPPPMKENTDASVPPKLALWQSQERAKRRLRRSSLLESYTQASLEGSPSTVRADSAAVCTHLSFSSANIEPRVAFPKPTVPLHLLQVLVLSGRPLRSADLAAALASTPRLVKLDASRCNLIELPPPAAQAPCASLTPNGGSACGARICKSSTWPLLPHLQVLFLHQNMLRQWDGVESAIRQCPVLVWLTLFENPLTAQAESRDRIVRLRPSLLALDYWLLTDSERLGLSTSATRHNSSCHSAADEAMERLEAGVQSATAAAGAAAAAANAVAIDAPAIDGALPANSGTSGSRNVSGAIGGALAIMTAYQIQRRKELMGSRFVGKITVSISMGSTSKPGTAESQHVDGLPLRRDLLGESQLQSSAHVPTSAMEKVRKSVMATVECDPMEEKVKAELVQTVIHELWVLRGQSNHCCASICIQSWWRAVTTRFIVKDLKKRLAESATLIQGYTKRFLWRKDMISYVKGHLIEIDELDLIASAKEMLRQRAVKLIVGHVRRFLGRRQQQKRVRWASEVIGRYIRGTISRYKLLDSTLGLTSSSYVYFPERNAWEFLALLNVVLRKRGLTPLPRNYNFEAAPYMGVHIPQVTEVPTRSTCLLGLRRFNSECLLRPIRQGRFPNHAWDGPFHRLCQADALPHIASGYRKVKRRGANVNNRCRKAFLSSCEPGPHPLHATDVRRRVCLNLDAFLQGSDSAWPPEARIQGSALNLFMEEARRRGSKTWQSRARHDGAITDPNTGLKDYSGTTWLSKTMLRCRCPGDDRVVVDLMMLAFTINRKLSQIPSIEPVPLLSEKDVQQIAAVTTLQASWRAHKVRCRLSCGILTALVTRRAAICIQRYWRWGLVKRRLQLLSKAVHYVEAVRDPVLYIEERVFSALNIISSVARYPPFMRERAFGIGLLSGDTDIPVFIRGSVRDHQRGAFGGVSISEVASSRASTSMPSAPPKPLRGSMRMPGSFLSRKQGGLPDWFVARLGFADMPYLGYDDSSLKRTCGLQGVLTECVLGDRWREEDQRLVVAYPLVQHLARTHDSQHGVSNSSMSHTNIVSNLPGISPAVKASTGTLRFLELRFPSLTYARQRAFMLFMCTYSAQYKLSVPWISKSYLHGDATCHVSLRLWECYGLCWHSEDDRLALYQLRRLAETTGTEMVPFCGKFRFIDAVGNSGIPGMRHIGSAGVHRQYSTNAVSDHAKYVQVTEQLLDKRDASQDRPPTQRSSLRGLMHSRFPKVEATTALAPMLSAYPHRGEDGRIQVEKKASMRKFVADVGDATEREQAWPSIGSQSRPSTVPRAIMPATPLSHMMQPLRPISMGSGCRDEALSTCSTCSTFHGHARGRVDGRAASARDSRVRRHLGVMSGVMPGLQYGSANNLSGSALASAARQGLLQKKNIHTGNGRFFSG